MDDGGYDIGVCTRLQPQTCVVRAVNNGKDTSGWRCGYGVMGRGG